MRDDDIGTVRWLAATRQSGQHSRAFAAVARRMLAIMTVTPACYTTSSHRAVDTTQPQRGAAEPDQLATA